MIPPELEVALKRHIRRWLGLIPPRPKQGVLSIAGSEVVSVLRYTFNLPSEPSNVIDDFSHREVEITIEGVADKRVIKLDKGNLKLVQDFDRDQNVSIVLRDYDTSGNGSDPSDPFTFLSKDTVPPPKPGDILGIDSVVQINEPAPAPVDNGPPTPAPTV